MTDHDLGRALHDLGDQAHHTDLLDRVLVASRAARRRRVMAVAASTMVVLGAATTVGVASQSSPPRTPPASAPAATSAPLPTPLTTPVTQPPSTAPAQSAPVVQAPTVYYRVGGGLDTTLYALTVGQAPRKLLSAPGIITVSPDLRHAAWVKQPDLNAEVDTAELHISDLDGRNARKLADITYEGGLCSMFAAWLPDSQRLITKVDTTPGGPWTILDITTGQRTPLDAAPDHVCYPTTSPDGSTIGWVGQLDSGVVLTDSLRGSYRTVPLIDGVDPPCRVAVYAVSPHGSRALVSRPKPDHLSCGDGPGITTLDGVVVDTATGKSLRLPITEKLATGVFLPDGSLLVRTIGKNELVLLDPQLRVVSRTPSPSADETMALLAYQP